jgi:hypothetical protein
MANQAADAPSCISRIELNRRIDLNGSGVNALLLGLRDV